MQKPTTRIATALLLLLVPAAAGAQGAEPADCTVLNRERGECSIGTDAPTREGLMNVIEGGSATKLMSTLEYGERVECDACVAPLLRRILSDDNARVREFSAWWIRKRPFHAGYAMDWMKKVLASDAEPTRRARAAEAIGEFMDPHGLAHLEAAYEGDESAEVRRAVVAGLGRLNHPGGRTALAAALADADAGVRLAALAAIRRVNFFSNTGALIAALGDDEAGVRREAALLLGQYRVGDAAEALGALLGADDAPRVRQAAAWALGRIGGEVASDALRAARRDEAEKTVLDAVEIALRM